MDDSRSRISELYREQGAKLWRALFSFTGDPDVASDGMAEAFARALHDASEIREPAAWMWRVAFRLARAELRRRSETPPFDESSYEMPEPVPELMAALKQLSPNQRLSVVLHDYADRPTAESRACSGAPVPPCTCISAKVAVGSASCWRESDE